MTKRRIGKILISAPLIDNMDIDEMLKVTSKFVVVRCEYLYHKDCFEYVAICPEFEEIPNDSELPTYSVEVKREITEEGKPPEIVEVKFISRD